MSETDWSFQGSNPLKNRTREDRYPTIGEEWILAEVDPEGNMWESKYGNKPLFEAHQQLSDEVPEPRIYYMI